MKKRRPLINAFGGSFGILLLLINPQNEEYLCPFCRIVSTGGLINAEIFDKLKEAVQLAIQNLNKEQTK